MTEKDIESTPVNTDGYPLDCDATGVGMFHVVCGNWVQVHEFIEERISGIVVAYVCPHCGGDNRILMDDGEDMPDDSLEHEWKPTNRSLIQQAQKSKLGR